MSNDTKPCARLPETSGGKMAALTVGGGCLGPVERADDDESEAFALLAVDDDITGLGVGQRSVRSAGGGVWDAVAGVVRLRGDGAVGVREVAAGGAVLRGD